ncbi:MAG: hypothetical protein JNN30_17145 [Rhodanobacteraceae bacterium]|nr:hypothetical protein [Rhodanobacteraceae bacterium]
MEQATQVFAAIYCFGIGLSHIAQPRAWIEFFTWLREKGRPGAFVEGFLSLGFGALVVAFHNVWSGMPLILTLLGWGQVLKGLARFAAPQLGLRAYEHVTPERAWQFQAAGVVLLALSGLFAYLARFG